MSAQLQLAVLTAAQLHLHETVVVTQHSRIDDFSNLLANTLSTSLRI
jgi:hypothetical protein